MAEGFANLPDRGALLAYDARAPGVRTAGASWHRIVLSEEHALHAIAGARMRVPTPSDGLLEIEYDSHATHGSENWSWRGHLAGRPEARTVLTFGPEAAFGAIGLPDGRALRLAMRDGASWIVEPAEPRWAAAPRRPATGSRPRRQDGVPVPALSRIPAAAASPRALRVQPAATADATGPVEVLVGYTDGFVDAIGGESAARTRVDYLGDLTNAIYEQSGAYSDTFRIVHAMRVDDPDDTSNQSALERLTGYDRAQDARTSPDPAFAELRHARELYGADLVVLLRAYREPEQEGCGTAWLVGGAKRGVSPGDGQDYFGYSVVSDGADIDETDGQVLRCADESMAHQLAHNLGSTHDRATAAGDDGVLDDPGDYGAFQYSFDWKASPSQGDFYTLMASGDPGQQYFRVFSSRDTLCGDFRCGNSANDNARSLRAMAPAIARFRQGRLGDDVLPSAPVGIVAGDFNRDRRDDVLWHHARHGRNVVWLSGNAATRRQLTGVTNAAWQVEGIGDFDRDGTSDIFWRNRQNGQNAIWRSGDHSTQTPVAAMADLAWQMAGTGDFNLDRRSDLWWHHRIDGRNVIWLSADSGRPIVQAASSAVAWQLVGIADFDGDGRSDVLWRHAGNGENQLWRSGTFSSQLPITHVRNLDWQVAGTGDFDGDGLGDILWRHRATGANAIWLAGNYASQRRVAAVTDRNWRIVGTGDFNGDGLDDILWRHAVSGGNAIWLSADTNRRQSLTTVTDLNWHIVG